MPTCLRRSGSTLCALLATIGLWGCGGGGGTSHVELSGQPPTEGSRQAADAICRRHVACGSAEVRCASEIGAATHCSASIVHSDYSSCFGEARPALEQLLACPALTAQDVDAIEGCIDVLAALACVTQAQADEMARAEEMNLPEPSNPIPPECDILNRPPPGCE